MVELISTQKSLTQQEIHDFESNSLVSLPEAFKKHYLKVNGGFVSEMDVEAGLWGLPVNGFNPIKYGNVTIEKLIEDIFEINPDDEGYGEWSKREFIPFAYDSGGNTIFLSLRKNDFDHVYLYSQDGDNIILIDSSIESFLNRLYKVE